MGSEMCIRDSYKGFRSWFFPDLYPNDQVQMSEATAIQLAHSRFFNPYEVFTDEQSPTIENAEIEGVENGHVRVSVSATDDGGLLAAHLIRNGHLIAVVDAEGTNATIELLASDIVGGTDQTLTVVVLDKSGRRTSQDLELTAAQVTSTAAVAKARISDTVISIGEEVLVDASRTFDRDGEESARL